MKPNLIIFLLFGCVVTVQAQDSLIDNHKAVVIVKDKFLLSNRAYYKYINHAFSQVAVGPTNGANLANYATFEPVGGSFSFNGFTPINAKNENRSRISYINFSVKGGVDGNNVGALFTNTKLNNNVNVSLHYHFGLNKSSITYTEAAKTWFKSR